MVVRVDGGGAPWGGEGRAASPDRAPADPSLGEQGPHSPDMAAADARFVAATGDMRTRPVPR